MYDKNAAVVLGAWSGNNSTSISPKRVLMMMCGFLYFFCEQDATAMQIIITNNFFIAQCNNFRVE